MVCRRSQMKWFHWLAFGIIIIIYLVLRLGWANTIEFGYDQPRLATTVLNFIKNGTFISSQSYALESPWGNISWGSSLVFFFALILKISQDPLVASKIIAVLNLISIIGIFYIGRKFFSLKTAFISALVLSVQPWWVIFSRMVYQPSFVPSLITISMLLTFLVIENPKKYFLAPLIFSWSLLTQFYLISLSFIVTGFLFVVSIFKKLNIYWTLAGIILSIGIFVPSFYYYKNNPAEFKKFISAPTKFKTSVPNVFNNYIKTVSGGNFEWELGYGYNDFLNTYSWVEPAFKIDLSLVLIILMYSLVSPFIYLKEKKFRMLLFLWTIAPLWFLILVKAKDVVPRYFLISLPPLSLLVGLFTEDIYRKIRIKKFKLFIFAIPILLIISWICIIVSYYKFIENYNYPRGVLSHFSDPPYVFLKNSFDYIISDSKSKGYESFTISNDTNRPPGNVFDWATSYMWNNIYKLKTGNVNVVHYYLYSKPAKTALGPSAKEFGPYIVYEYFK